MKTQCLLVDDEPLALEVLETYLSELSNIEIAAKCSNAIQAFEILQQRHIDILFLDINMPQLDGLSFLKTLQDPPHVIITTAYREYALDGYDLDIVDYLLKPISLDRFMKAINRYYAQKRDVAKEIQSNGSAARSQDQFIYVKSDKKTLKVFLKDIYYIESMEDYVVIHRRDSRIITKDQIGRLEELLPPELFLRIHRSYIVSIQKIEAITSDAIEIAKKELSIGRSYKKAVFNILHH